MALAAVLRCQCTVTTRQADCTLRRKPAVVTRIATHRTDDRVAKGAGRPAWRWRCAMTCATFIARRHRNMSRRRKIRRMTGAASGGDTGVIKRNVKVPRDGAAMAAAAVYPWHRRDMSGVFARSTGAHECAVVTGFAEYRRHNGVTKRRRHPSQWRGNPVASDTLDSGRHWNMRGGRLVGQMASVATRGEPRVIERHAQIPGDSTLVAIAAVHACRCGNVVR